MNAPALLVVCGTLLAILLVLFLPISRPQRRVHVSIDRVRSFAGSRDDDRYWYAGFLYNNPDDPDLFVPKRSGFGWTINFGHPRSKLVIIVLFLLLTLPPLLTAFVTGGAPVGCHPSGCYPFP